jgi:glyoxylate carboligase
MDYAVQLSFENINSPELKEYGVDHVKVAEGLGCKAIRVRKQEEMRLTRSDCWTKQGRAPCVLKVVSLCQSIVMRLRWHCSWLFGILALTIPNLNGEREF